MRILYSLVTLMLTAGLALAACVMPPATPGGTIPAPTAVPAGESAARLSWEGTSAQGACLALTILDTGLDTGEAQVGLCGDTPKTVEFSTGPDSEWAAVLSHFASVDVTTAEGHLRFQGQGTASGAAWEQALNTWAKFTAQELQAGRTSAAGRTVLAWRLAESPDQAGQCERLIVLAYGYAYANLAPCDGNGPAQLVAQGWLETAEWETLAGWLADAARIEDAAGYLDAHGDTPLTADELSAWAAAVYERIAGR